ncbi:glycoside hydrolase family 108 protein [Breoghania sp. JC706]|uniref:glycoside hydrolase family 108 protein n=1 Tax=Breoghania sp. JC706 TaxID=3117732 RepID=UPI0030091C65
MSFQNYRQCLEWVLAYEGGYIDHPKDPGGATNRGVTQRVYTAYRKRLGLSTQSVRHITADEVASIYRSQYWDAIRGDGLPAGVEFAVFDFAVNSGVRRAVKALQRALGIRADGIIGNITLAAARAADPESLITAVCKRRMSFLHRLSTFATFGRGWTHRVEGYRARFQPGDTGVLDRAILLARSASR